MSESRQIPPARAAEQLQAVVGAACSEVALLEDRSIQLRFTGTAEFDLWAPLPWRVRSEGRVALSDWDEPEQVRSLLPALVGRRLLAVALEPPGLSLRLTLDGDTTIETFTTRRDGTHWAWSSAGGTLVAGPGGELHDEG